MMRNFDLKQEDVAARVGKARTTIANILRLLDLRLALVLNFGARFLKDGIHRVVWRL